MKFISFYVNIEYIFILLFISLISKSSSLYFTYPNAITLKNRNIFIIHKDGITICDSNYLSIIKNIITFSSTEKLSESNLHLISLSQFDDGHIICIIINKLYIFDMNGNEEFSKVLSSDYNYNLAVEKVSDKKYYYLIGYINNQNKLHLYYYKYNTEDKTNTFISKLENYNHYYNNNNYNLLNKVLTCQFLRGSTVEYIFCAYYFKCNNIYYMSYTNFDYNSQEITHRNNKLGERVSAVNFIKSAISDDHKNVLVGHYDSNGYSFISIYHIGESIIKFRYTDFCKYNKYYSLAVDYFGEKDEFSFSCLTKDENAVFAIFYQDNIDNKVFNKTRYFNCNLNEYSLLYLLNNNNYYILSDLICGKKE